ncbi:MAG: MATE family efflux transporter [Enterocloster sp.]
MKDLTKGNPAKIMLQFALPVALGNIFQLFYSLADTRVVGSTLGETALAAVGATTSISTLFVGFLSGLTNGFAILIAREFGAGREKGVRKFAAGSLLLGFLTALSLTLLCVGGLPILLNVLNVPEELMDQSASYIRIVLLGLVMTMFYNACAGILRAVGDTAAPLAFLVCASILNIGLDLLLILVFHMGVAGAALATVIAQTVSVVLSLIYMFSRYPVFRFRPEDFKLSLKDTRLLYTSGLSMAAMMSLVYFGTLSLQCAINTFGNDIIVAHTAARKITEFFMLPFSVMGITMATYCGQNMGAGKMDRIRSGVRQALILTCIWCVGMMILSYTAAPELVYLVTGSRQENIAATAELYLKVDTLFYFAPAAINIFRNALQGMGEHRTPVVSSFIELAGKVAVALFLAPVLHYWGIIVAEPIVWILMVIPLIIRIKEKLGRRSAE